MSTTKTKNMIAAAALAGTALCLALVFYAGQRLGDGLQGPSKIARAPDGRIWVASHGALHRFSPAGEREAVFPLSELGRAPFVSEVLPLADGSVVLAEAEPSAGYRCDLAAKRCEIFTQRVAGQVGPLRHALMIAADEKRRRFYVSDNANHRLVLLDFDGKVLDVTPFRRVIYPNELALAKPGELMVVDTNHHRLVRIAVAKDRFGEDRWEMRTDSSGLHRPERTGPMDFAPAPGGGWWVLNARPGMKDADLLLFGADGKARKRVDLGAASDPTQILAFDGGVLVAEPTRATLLRVSADGAVAGPWGGAAFNADLADLRATRSAWRSVRLAAQLLLVVLPLAAIGVLWKLGERLPERGIRPAAGVAPVPVAEGIHWIGVRPQYVRRTRIMLGTMFAALLVLGVVIVLLLAFGTPAPRVPKVAVAIAAALLVAILAVHGVLMAKLRRAFRQRLGTDGRDFFFDPGDGKPERYSFTSLLTGDGRQLLAGKRLIPLRAPLAHIFDPDEVRGYVFARMIPSARIGGFALTRQALNQGNREIWIAVIVCFGAAVVFFLPSLFPRLVPHIKLLVDGLLAAAGLK